MFHKTRAEFGYFTLLFCSKHQRIVQSFMIELFITTFCSFDLIIYDTHDSREKGMLFTLPSCVGASVLLCALWNVWSSLRLVHWFCALWNADNLLSHNLGLAH